MQLMLQFFTIANSDDWKVNFKYYMIHTKSYQPMFCCVNPDCKQTLYTAV